MKHTRFPTTLALLCGTAILSAQNATPPPTAEKGKQVPLRESTEWVHLWLPGMTASDKPKVLLVGDSITQGYQGGVTKALASKATVGYFVTSLCVADPAFEPAFKSVLMLGKFDVIHFNNGLHGVGFTEAQYEEGYRKSLEIIRQLQPGARVTLALSTPLQDKSNKAFLNPQMDARNAIVRKIAKENKLGVNDLHSPMLGHPEFYQDPYHYKPQAIGMQTALVAKAVESTLGTPHPNP